MQAERLHLFSHDVKNKLVALHQAMLHSQELADPAERAELLELAERSYFGALRQLEQLLDDFGVPRGAGTVRLRIVDIDALVMEATNEVLHRLDRKEQSPALPEGSSGVRGMADPYYLKEVLQALLSNASKFSPRGTTIEVDIRGENGSAVISVRDHGVGLSAEDQRDVFIRYAWLSSRSTEGEAQGRGTLARAKQWVALQNGELSVQSDGPGKGCTFTVRLPLV